MVVNFDVISQDTDSGEVSFLLLVTVQRTNVASALECRNKWLWFCLQKNLLVNMRSPIGDNVCLF